MRALAMVVVWAAMSGVASAQPVVVRDGGGVVVLERPRVLGNPSREVVERFLRRQVGRLLACVAAGQEHVVTARLRVSYAGTVDEVSQVKVSPASDRVVGCVRRTMRDWRFAHHFLSIIDLRMVLTGPPPQKSAPGAPRGPPHL